MNCRLLPGIDWERERADRLTVFLPNGALTIDGIELATSAEFLLDGLKSGDTPRDDLLQRAAISVSTRAELCRYAYKLLLNARALVENDTAGALSEIESFHHFRDGDTRKLDALRNANVICIGFWEDAAGTISAFDNAGMSVTVRSLDDTSVSNEFESRAWNLAVSIGLPFHHPFTRLLNRAAVTAGTPVLFSACGGSVARVGPTVIGRNLACLDCVAARHAANGGGDRPACLDGLEEGAIGKPARPLSHPALRHLLLQHTALESARILQGEAPLSFGGYLELSCSGLSVRREVLKVPGCSACSSSLPERYPFDVTPLS